MKCFELFCASVVSLAILTLLALALGACSSPTAPVPAATSWKESPRCYVIQIEKPRRSGPTSIDGVCRMVP